MLGVRWVRMVKMVARGFGALFRALLVVGRGILSSSGLYQDLEMESTEIPQKTH